MFRITSLLFIITATLLTNTNAFSYDEKIEKIIKKGTIEQIQKIDNIKDIINSIGGKYVKKSLFTIAVENRDSEVINFLLDNGADPNQEDELGNRPIRNALLYNKDLKVIDLLKDVTNLQSLNKEQLYSLLSSATAGGKKNFIRYITSEVKFPINYTYYRGNTALHDALGFNQLSDEELIDLIVFYKELGFDFKKRSKKGYNILDVMAEDYLRKRNPVTYEYIKEEFIKAGILSNNEPSLDIALKTIYKSENIKPRITQICGANNFKEIDILKKGVFNMEKRYLPIMIKIDCRSNRKKNSTPVKVFYSEDFSEWRAKILEE